MSRLIAFTAAGLLAGMSLAQARESTLSMSCRQAASLVASRGAVVLSTGRHTFDRFVATPGFCFAGEWGEPAWAPTRDGSCRLGYICRSGDPPWEDSLFFRR
jgi:hypothetical protein